MQGEGVRGINPRYWTLVFPTALPGITTVASFPHKKTPNKEKGKLEI